MNTKLNEYLNIESISHYNKQQFETIEKDYTIDFIHNKYRNPYVLT